MDKDTATGIVLITCAVTAVGIVAYMAFDQYRTTMAVRAAHTELVRLATEQDIARRVDGGY